jgi:transposase-like protein
MSGIDGAEGRPSGSSEQERSEEAEGLPGGRSERREAARSWRRDRAGRRRFSRTEREELLEALVGCGEDEESFCRSHDLSLTTLRAWQARKKLPRGETASSQKGRPRRYTPEQKRAALEAFQRSGRTQAEFAALWGISAHTLAAWSKRYAQHNTSTPVSDEARRVRWVRPCSMSEHVRELPGKAARSRLKRARGG